MPRIEMPRIEMPMTDLRARSGQAAVEYVMICAAIVLTLALVGYGTANGLCSTETGLAAGECGNVFVELGKLLSDNLAALTLLLSLPF